MGRPLVNFRVDEDLDAAIENAAATEGVVKSVLLREIVASVVLGGVTLAELRTIVVRNGKQDYQPHPERRLNLQIQDGGTSILDGCRHPMTARQQLTFTVVCSLCGAVVKRT